MILDRENWKFFLSKGFSLKSSGATGDCKSIFQPPEKLAFANKIALEAQHITRSSRILTICKMNHAGGALAQTLPALSIDAHVKIKGFNAYRFWQDIKGFTHTHLTPTHCEALIKTRTFSNINLNGLFITCGSDRVPFNVIHQFVAHGAKFMCNWGMTEIGPITINTLFSSIDDVTQYQQQALSTGSLMGDCYYCDYKIENGTLHVKGEQCVYNDWFDTKDRVNLNDHAAMYFISRQL